LSPSPALSVSLSLPTTLSFANAVHCVTQFFVAKEIAAKKSTAIKKIDRGGSEFATYLTNLQLQN
jgi:hypothetical protein